jgi:hypothetical protein
MHKNGLLLVAVLAAAAGCRRDPGGNVETRASALTTPISQFLIYGERSVSLARDARVTGGDVGVRARAAASFGTQLKVGQTVQVDTSRAISSPSVSLDAGSVVGKVNTDALTNNGGTRGALAAFPAADMPAGPTGGGAAGTTNVSVASGANRTLDPGSYGALSIAGTGAVYLKPGNFWFASVTLADRAILVANGTATSNVFVAGQLIAGTRATLSTVSGGAGALSIVVGGNDGAKKAVTIGSYGSVVALIAAPHGTLSLADHTDAKGAFAAFDVAVGEAVVLTYQKGFTPVPTPPQPLSGYVTSEIASAPLMGPVPQDKVIDVAIGLALPNREALVQKVRDVSDPASASYRQYLTPAQATTAYSPTAANYTALTSWATAAGLTVTESPANRLLLHVRGTAAKLGQALASNFVFRARPDGTSFYTVDREPAVTLAASNPIFRISGLDDLSVPVPLVGSGPLGSYVSADFRNAYADCATNKGAGEKVGLVEFDGFKASDVTGYGCAIGLVTCDAAGNVTAGTLPPVTSVLIDGYDGAVRTPGGSQEVTLDIQVAMAMAPGLAGITVFQARGGGAAVNNHILNAMAADPSIRQLSSSWGFKSDGNTQHILYMLSVQGQSFMEAAGDRGSSSWSGDPGDIRSMDAVTVVGGTRLNLDNHSRYDSEEVFNFPGQGAAGGGLAASTPTPLYQAPFARALGVGNRMLPDVSMTVSAGFFFDGTFGATFGTSVSAPLFAGWMALANEQSRALGIAPAGFVNPFLYTVGGAATPIYEASFHDIADGHHNAGSCPTAGGGICASGWTVSTTSTSYTAVAGYDMATGLGTPRCHLLDELGTSTIQAPAPDGGADAGAGDAGSDALAAPSIAVVATEGGRGVMFCMQGGGFPEGSQVQFKYLALPGGLQPMNQVSAPLIVGLGGRYTNYDMTFGGGASSLYGFNTVNCSADDLTKSMTVQVTQVDDPSRVATASISNTWICGAEPRQTGFNLTPLPFPINNITSCPLPPD